MKYHFVVAVLTICPSLLHGASIGNNYGKNNFLEKNKNKNNENLLNSENKIVDRNAISYDDNVRKGNDVKNDMTRVVGADNSFGFFDALEKLQPNSGNLNQFVNKEDSSVISDSRLGLKFELNTDQEVNEKLSIDNTFTDFNFFDEKSLSPISEQTSHNPSVPSSKASTKTVTADQYVFGLVHNENDDHRALQWWNPSTWGKTSDKKKKKKNLKKLKKNKKKMLKNMAFEKDGIVESMVGITKKDNNKPLHRSLQWWNPNTWIGDNNNGNNNNGNNGNRNVYPPNNNSNNRNRNGYTDSPNNNYNNNNNNNWNNNNNYNNRDKSNPNNNQNDGCFTTPWERDSGYQLVHGGSHWSDRTYTINDRGNSWIEFHLYHEEGIDFDVTLYQVNSGKNNEIQHFYDTSIPEYGHANVGRGVYQFLIHSWHGQGPYDLFVRYHYC